MWNAEALLWTGVTLQEFLSGQRSIWGQAYRHELVVMLYVQAEDSEGSKNPAAEAGENADTATGENADAEAGENENAEAEGREQETTIKADPELTEEGSLLRSIQDRCHAYAVTHLSRVLSKEIADRLQAVKLEDEMFPMRLDKFHNRRRSCQSYRALVLDGGST